MKDTISFLIEFYGLGHVIAFCAFILVIAVLIGLVEYHQVKKVERFFDDIHKIAEKDDNDD